TYEVVRAYWRSLFDASSPRHQAVRADWQAQGLLAAFTGDFEAWWRRALHDGLVRDTALPPRSVTLRPAWARAPGARLDATQELESAFRPAPPVSDAPSATTGWLKDLPNPLTKLPWDNPPLMTPAPAVRLGLAPSADRAPLANEQVVELQYQGRTVPA